jgi:tRNA threonylcarbamoyladenosine biosynthesis protein TsaB
MWLALETATDRASVAVGDPGGILAEESLTGARQHASGLLPMALRTLARGGTTLEELEGIIVADGPGSFTGLRVGAAVGKALAHARGLSLWTAPALMALALGAGAPEESLVLAVSDALRGEVYAAAFRFHAARVDTVVAPSVFQLGTLTARLTPPAVIIGDLPAPLRQLLEAWSGLEVQASVPGAGDLLRLIGQHGGARRVAKPAEWEPEYGRPAEAQTRWEQAHGRRLPDSAGLPR